MARPRKPTNVLELNGAFRKNPARGREREGEAEPKAGIGPAPSWFGKKQVEAWDDLVRIAPIGVLGDSDRVYLELTAELLALKRRLGVLAMDRAKLNKLEAMLGKLGLNPSDRSRVKVTGHRSPAPAPGNPFTRL